MTSPPRQNWFDRLAVVYLTLAVLVTIGLCLVDGFNTVGAIRASLSTLVALVIALLVLAAMWFWLTKKRKHWRKVGSELAKKVLSHSLFRTVVSFWMAFGLQTYAIGSLLAMFGHRHSPGTGLIEALLLGPPAIFFVLSHTSPIHGSATSFLVLYLGWTVGVGVLVFKHREHLVCPPSDLFTKALGTQACRAPDKEPRGAHYAEIVDSHVVPLVLSRPDNRIALGRAELAERWGGKKEEVLLGLPSEGSGLVFGGPNSGKSTLIALNLLSLCDATHRRLRPVRVVALSTKPQSLTRPTVNWLRSQGATVQHWDLSGEAAKPRHYGRLGDTVRWSPLMAISGLDGAGDADRALEIATRLVESTRSPESQAHDQFWLEQPACLLGPAMLAAVRAGKDYETAIRWTRQWGRADFDEVDRILEAEGEATALHTWAEVRKTVLRQTPIGWAETTGFAVGQAQGVAATINGIFKTIATQEAFRATADPTFDPRVWLRSTDRTPNVLFLSSAQKQKDMSRGLLAPFLENLITAATDYAREQPGERLPYRLAIFADELANLAPINKLAEFFADSRAFGIQILAGFQTYSQIEGLYGQSDARTIFSTSRAKLFLSGLEDDRLVNVLSTVVGREETERTSEHEGKDQKSKTTSTQIQALIDGQILHALMSMDLGIRDDEAEDEEAHEREPHGGQGLLVAPGVVAKVRTPIWPYEEPWCDRGAPISRYHEKWLANRHNRGGLSGVRQRLHRLSGDVAPERPREYGPVAHGVAARQHEPMRKMPSVGAAPETSPGTGKLALADSNQSSVGVRTPLCELRGTDRDVPPRPVAAMGSTSKASGRIMSTLGAGWHPDPAGLEEMRYFDGRRWTERVMRSADRQAAVSDEALTTYVPAFGTRTRRHQRQRPSARQPARHARFVSDLKQLIELRRSMFDAVNTARVPKVMAAIFQEQVEQAVVRDPDGRREWGITWLQGLPQTRTPGGSWQQVLAWPTELAA
jgi:hypothetical protein